ncbi:DMT family transporter [Ilumatobacter sp.]|uniref:DMT family transporter n=1 Tax=Ilumatobacter sp. TaxID=1967498 RepID=UPI003AF5707D
MRSSTSVAATAPEDVELQARDWVALALPGLIWGSSFFLIAEGLDAFSPYLVTWLRIVFGCAALMLVPAARVPVPRAAWSRIVVLGIIWMALPLSLFSLAQERVSSSVTGMINGGTPLMTALVAAFIARAFPPGRQFIGLTIGLAGIVLTALPTWSDGGSSAAGVLMIIGAISCYGIALNLAGPMQRQFGSLPVMVRSLGVALLLTSPLGIIGVGDSSFAWRSAVAVAVLGALGTGLAFVLMASNAGSYGSTRASSTTYIIPGVALFLGLTFRGESVAPIAVLGSVVAMSGAYLVNTARAGIRA